MASLEQRIAQRLHDALTQLAAAEFSIDTTRGLAYGGHDRPVIAMTVEDVARTAAQVVAEPPDRPE
jgi:hypothetical protein